VIENIIIRKVEEADIKQFFLLINRVWRNAYKNIFPKEVFDERDENIKTRITRFKELNLDKDGHIALVALDGKQVVAIASANNKSGYEHYKKLGYADLIALYVDEGYQHKGLGKELFNLVKDEFKKQSCNKMVIGVLKDNLQARKAYEKWGGKLDDYEAPFERLGKQYQEVFYTYDL